MATKRSYEDACGTAHALDLIGERWALLVVREMLLGPKRFTDLRRGLPGISPNVLSQRLDELEQSGVVRRRRYAPPMATYVYELTDWGQDLGDVIAVLGRWGARSPLHDRTVGLSTDSIAISLRTMFDPLRASGFRGTIELRLEHDTFAVTVDGGRFDIARGAATRPDAILTTQPTTLARLVYEGYPVHAAESDGVLTVEGDRAATERFLSLFTLPPPAAAAEAKT
ncbi:MAG TPA: winged helix-turn-helix transcriptional regulator [Candidatus Limnocylindrales bacterium]